jgi:hypothetical protein
MSTNQYDEWENDPTEPWHGDDSAPDVAAPVMAEPVTIESPTVVEEDDDKETKSAERVGGFAFFLSLGALLPTGLLTLVLSLRAWDPAFMRPTGIFAASALAGTLVAHFLIRGHISVLIHEFKHSLVSGLVGNKRKGMKIGKSSGHFEYAYTKRTAHMNAFISLAPYILPLFTFVGCLVAFAAFRHDHELAVLIIGIAYGTDLVLNMRDISPIQTDINLIRGGYHVGLLYIAAWNFTIFGVLLAWVFQGAVGLMMLLEAFSKFFVAVHAAFATRRGE